MKKFGSIVLAATVLAAVPSLASADRWHDRHAQKEQWKDVAVVGGVVGILGAATHNPGLAAIGAGAAIYGGVRYEDESGHGHYGRVDRRRDEDRRWEERRREDRREDRRERDRHNW